MPNDAVDKVRSAHRGATFVRADLHLHSFGPGGSYDVADSGMTPEAIVAEAERLGISVVAITDHNATGNVGRAVTAAEGRPVLVVPGVELSTPAGHLLVYAENQDKLGRIVGRLSFSEDRKACRTSAAEVLLAVEEFGGIAIAAHIDLDSGIEAQIPGFGDAKASVIASRTLVAVEVANRSALTWYTASDPEEPRRRLLTARLDAHGDPLARGLPRIQSSDAHALRALGRNWANEEKLTRLKMSSLDWVSFRAAFADGEARVRVENVVPERVPQFVGMYLEGGFLDAQTLPFSPNLTCIIGGRGSGKSTAFQVLRKFVGHDPAPDLAQSEVWPERARLVFRDEVGREHVLGFDGDGEVHLVDGPGPRPVVEIECLQQGEMARTIETCGRDPSTLLAFLDQLVDLEDLPSRLSAARDALIANGREIEELDTSLAAYDEVKRQLEFKTRQQGAAKEANSERLIKLQTDHARAVQARRETLSAFDRTAENLSGTVAELRLTDLEELADAAAALAETPGEDPFPGILERFRKALSSAHGGLDSAAKSSRPEVVAFLERCRQRQDETQRSISEEVEKLRAQGVQLDTKFLTTLAAEVEKLDRRVKALDRQRTRRVELERARADLLREHRSLHSEVSTKRQALAARLTTKLREFLVDWEISLKFGESMLAPDAEAALKESMEWRTAQVPKASALIRAMGVPAVLEAIRKKDSAALAAARTPDGGVILAAADAAEVVRRLSDFRLRRRLEECGYSDMPRLTVARRVLDEAGKPTGRVRTQEFAKLSLGQQQSIILAILLSVPGTRPLLIDQPEDNLDSAFIFQILVRALRSIKESRQVILVTHNANIAVLADSDLVVPLKATADKAYVLTSGTVEGPKVRDVVCDILEGGRAAYQKRGRLYAMDK